MQLKKQAVVQACGAKYHIREEFLDETDVDDVVVALVSLARKVSLNLHLHKCPPYFVLYNWYSQGIR